MAPRFDSPRRAIAIGAVALASLGFALFLLLGDSDSEPERELERSAIRIDSGETPVPAQTVSPAADPVNGSKAPAKPEDPDGAGLGSRPGSSQGTDRRDESSAPPAAAEGTCPPEFTREECESFAQAAAAQGDSVVVNQARDCLKVMSRAECVEWLRQMKAAQAQSGDSYRPEDCLDHASREQCKEYAEQMREASQ